MSYLKDSRQPAFSTIEDDAMTADFLNSRTAPYLAGDRSPNYEDEAVEEAMQRQRDIYQQIQGIEQRTLESTKRSQSAIIDSEKVGIDTAQTLVQQREQLERTNTTVDKMNSDLKQTQKDIDSMKSVWSRMKKWVSNKFEDEEKEPKGGSPTPTGKSKIRNDDLRKAMEYSDKNPTGLSQNEPVQSFDYKEGELKEIADFKAHTRRVNEELDADLDKMTSGLINLKHLARGLGSEVQEQNELLDTMRMKTENVDLTLEKQNRQINKLLKKK